MNIHEYQAKFLLKQYNVAIPEGIMVENPKEATDAAEKISRKTGSKSWAVKAQIHAGGRGKGGGIRIAHSIEEVKMFAGNILGMNLVTRQTGPAGKKVHKILIEQNIYYPGNSEIIEYYLSILLNRASEHNTIVYSKSGGMNIEKVAAEKPSLIKSEEIEPNIGLQAFQARKIAFDFGLQGTAFKEMTDFITSLYKAYESVDASLIEINPVIKTSENKIIAADAKIIIDDNALFRHPEYLELDDNSEKEPDEVEAAAYNLNFIKLEGSIGCMVNGAGLAMATMDIIKLSGGEPANFLDVGGTANVETIKAGFEIILKDPKVKGILINIFGGIVRCDRVAQGIVDAYKAIGIINVPLIIRFQGTNAIEGKKIIDESGLKVHSVITLKEAADMLKLLA